MKRYLPLTLTALAALFSNPAFAHHPMGGSTPSTFSDGLLSGIGHPIIGLDHLAFVVAVGIAALAIGSRIVLPLAFILATVLGTTLHVMAINLPAVELIISLSVLVAGALLMFAVNVPLAIWAALFSAAGLFHGHAYGEAIFGAEATPLMAYLAGFGLIQYAVAIASGTIIYSAWGKTASLPANAPARLAGAMVAGAGALLVGEMVIGAVLGA